MSKKIYACYATSDYFCPHTGISILSLFEHNAEVIEKLFVLDYGILDNNKKKLNDLAASYNVPLEYIDADTVLQGIKEKLGIEAFRGSLATYSRAFIDFIMPEYVDRLLYIDSDTVVTGKINEILDFDMTNKVIAGAIDVERYGKKKGTDSEFPLLTGNNMYIGCGIVLYDLNNWRNFKCCDMIAEVCKKDINLRYADQTLINNSIPEKYLAKLPLAYNYAGHIFNPHWEKTVLGAGEWYTGKELDEAVKNPVIIHFKGSSMYRPWYDKCCSTKAEEYIKYKAVSPWKDVPFLSLDEFYNELPSKKEKIDFQYKKIRVKLPCRWMVSVCNRLKNIIIKVQGL